MDKNKIFHELENQRIGLGLTFAAVDRIFEKNGFDYHGDFDIVSPINSKIILWINWNQDAIDLITEYQHKFNLNKLPTNILMYLTSGKCVALPLVKAKSLKQAQNYKTRRWLPTQFVTQSEYDRA